MKTPLLFLFVFTLGNFTLIEAAGCCGQKRRKKESVIAAIKRKIDRILKKSVHEESSEQENVQEIHVVDQQIPQECEGEECPVMVENEHNAFIQSAQDVEMIKRNEMIEVVENVVNEVLEKQDSQLTPEELSIVVQSLVENIMNQDQEETSQENA